MVIAIARPQWGFDWQEARQRGLDIVVAIDTSRSMLAADIPPNRLARAKLAALDLKRIARPDRLGLVAFAGSAFLQCPLSFDDEAFRQSVNALDVNIIPVPGSAIAEAIETARSAFKEKNDNYRVLLLFTDGEDNEGRALEAAERAAKDGMLILTIGVGTANGELLRITDAKGRTDFVRDEQGNVIKSRLNEDLLGKIARAGNGVYMLLSGANTMELLYERRLEPLPKSEFTARRVKRYHERYQWFLGLALVLLLLEMFLPERKRGRRRPTIGTPLDARRPLAKAAAAVVVMLLPISALASSAAALKKYHSGNYKSALREYERLLTERPDEPRLHYNAGAAAFQTGDYEKSIKHFNSALAAQDLELQQRAFYNLGNAQYRAGEQDSNPASKQTQWQDAIKNYDSALKLNPKDADAEYNRELVRKKLEELKKQQQQQNQQKQEDEKKDQEKKDEQSKQDQDQKQDQRKSNEQQQEQQKTPDQKRDEQKKEEEQQQSKESEKQEQQKPQQDKQPQGAEQGTNEQRNATSSPQQMLQMTPEQAQRLLESMKSEEKVMIFVPQQGRTNRANRALKDW